MLLKVWVWGSVGMVGAREASSSVLPSLLHPMLPGVSPGGLALPATDTARACHRG